MAKLKITQVRSKNGCTKTPVTEGQLAKIRHLVTVEEI